MAAKPPLWRGLDLAFEELTQECTDVARGLTVRVWNGILSKTPQYEGRMAASWTYSIGAPEAVDRSPDTGTGVHTTMGYYKHGVTPLRRGDPVAMGIANAASRGRDGPFRLGDKVFIANGVNHGEGPYSGAIEDGSIRLRAENGLGAPAQRTVDWVGLYFDIITENKAHQLKKLRIGDIDASDNS